MTLSPWETIAAFTAEHAPVLAEATVVRLAADGGHGLGQALAGRGDLTAAGAAAIIDAAVSVGERVTLLNLARNTAVPADTARRLAAIAGRRGDGLVGMPATFVMSLCEHVTDPDAVELVVRGATTGPVPRKL